MARYFLPPIALFVLALTACGTDPGTDTPVIVSTESDAADAGTDDMPVDESDGGDMMPDCSAPLLTCSDTCVDPRVNAAHCGDCETTCGDGELCVQGGCEAGVEDCRTESCPTGHACDESDGQCKPDCVGDSCSCVAGQDGLSPATILAGSPRAIAVADFDADGLVDVVSTGYARDEVEFARSLGNGTFEPVALGFGEYPSDIVALDVRGDGTMDIVVANSPSSTSQIQLAENDGQGVFAPPVTLSLGARLEQLAAADLNGDGLDDLVGLHSYQQTLVIALQQPGGSFEPTSHILTVRPEAVVIADLDDDGQLDFVIGDGTISQAQIAVYWGSPSGPVEGPAFELIGSPRLAVGDVNGDGVLDIVGLNTIGRVHLIYGQGARQFSARIEIHDAESGGDVLIADVTSDGLDDIIVSRGRWFDADGDGVDILVSAASETFSTTRLAAGGSPLGIALADQTSDGVPDLVVGNFRSRTLSVLEADGVGSFGSAEILDLENLYIGAERVVLHDLDADGLDDVIIMRENGISVFHADDLGTEVDYPGPFAPDTVEVGDFTGDGLPDLVIGTHQSSNIGLRRGYPDGTFAAVEDLSVGFDAYGLALADLDEDGRLDIVTSSSSDSSLYVGFGDGTGGIREVVEIESQATGRAGIALGDYDADGHLDIAVAHGRYQHVTAIAIYYGSGSTSLSEQLIALEDDADIQAIVAADLDADGAHELFVSVAEAYGGALDPYVALVDPRAATPIVRRQTVAYAPYNLFAADNDGNGHVDLFTSWQGRMFRYAGTGIVGLGQPEVLALDADHLALGHVDDDGHADLVFVRRGTPWFGIGWGRACP